MANIPVSTIPAVSEYLLTTLKASLVGDALYDSMLVKLGEPATNLPNDAFIIGKVNQIVKPFAFVGSGAEGYLEETYEVTVSIRTWIGSGDADDESAVALAINGRAWDLVAYVTNFVREDPSLGGLVLQSYPLGAESTGPIWSEGSTVGLLVQIDMPIYVEATL